MLFKTSLDKTAIIITLLFTALFAGVIAIVWINVPGDDSVPPIYIVLFLLLLYCLAFAFHPTGYKLTGDMLFICRPIGPVRIARTTIKNIQVIDKKELSGAIRTFGVGGLFGYYGCFANFSLGSMAWYATRKDHAVLIVMHSNKKIVVTPDDVTAFITALKA